MAAKQKKNKASAVFAEAASEMLKRLEKIDTDNPDWRCPWHEFEPDVRNVVSEERYKGMNWVFLGFSMWIHNTDLPEEEPYNIWWGTYKQWQQKNRVVRKGEKATRGIYYGTYDVQPDPTPANPDPKPEIRFVGRTFPLFNYAQTDPDGDNAWIPPSDRDIDMSPETRQEEIDEWIQGFCDKAGVGIAETGSPSRYKIGDSQIQTLPKTDFSTSDEYYSSLFADIARSTAAASKEEAGETEVFRASAVNYDTDPAAKALEDLTADLGSALMCSIAGVKASPDRQKTAAQQKASLQAWQELLADDPDSFRKAVMQAQKAVRIVTDNSDIAVLSPAHQTSQTHEETSEETEMEHVSYMDMMSEILENASDYLTEIPVGDVAPHVTAWLADLDRREQAGEEMSFPDAVEVSLFVKETYLIAQKNSRSAWETLLWYDPESELSIEKNRYSFLICENIITTDVGWTYYNKAAIMVALAAGLLKTVGRTEVLFD